MDKSTAINVKSPDTDVAVIGIGIASRINCDLLFRTGTQHRARVISLTKIAERLGDKCEALIGMHALTGCDSISSFKGKGKGKAFKLLQQDTIAKYLSEIGRTFQVSDDLFHSLEGFVCALYGKPTIGEVNEARYRLFAVKSCQSSQLPPCQHAFRLHVERANYQAAIWRRALECEPAVPDPALHGWERVDEELRVTWFDKRPAPLELLQLVSCGCSGDCKTRACSCRSASLKCTDACKCGEARSCTNGKMTGHDSEGNDESDEEECCLYSDEESYLSSDEED